MSILGKGPELCPRHSNEMDMVTWHLNYPRDNEFAVHWKHVKGQKDHQVKLRGMLKNRLTLPFCGDSDCHERFVEHANRVRELYENGTFQPVKHASND